MNEINQHGLDAGLELWGGVECTVNRVQDQFFCQMSRNGHADRLDDLDRFASLGIRAIRYPVLWERIAPTGLDQADWTWAEQRLSRLQQLKITPIVGFVHHGSGPRHTSLVDPSFATGVAEYAGAVAARFPWLEFYTPINEPLTTARFSGLYGFWYPHGRDEQTFVKALLNQCRAIVLSMRAIRQVNPKAKLVQTDDLGKTYSTSLLAYQAKFQNELRWLSWDLLCGRVNPRHSLWKWLIRKGGASKDELEWFSANPCPPDIIGVNYYVTSERLLDERLSNYPSRCHGGNKRHRYADIEASRALAFPVIGLKPLLQEAWERYQLPLAVTEAHIDASRDDQMRWLAEIWQVASQAKASGIDMRAVTVWSLLGSYDWNCLVTEVKNYYESGAFDLRGSQPRPTAVAALMRELAAGRMPVHPVLASPGWWRRPERFLCPPVTLPGYVETAPEPTMEIKVQARPILVTGATGTLGTAFARICQERGLTFKLLSRRELDIADHTSVQRAIEHYQPWAIINAAGYVRVDEAEGDAERCYRENTIGPAVLAAVCARERVQFLTFSSDLVFDGRRQSPYVETDTIAPLSVYGKSKAEAELRVMDRHPESLVVRTSSFFGPWDDYNFITIALRTLANGRSFAAAHDMIVSPTYVPDLVHACLDLLIDAESGIWHLTNGHPITWADLALRAADLANVDSTRLNPCHSDEFKFIAKRPSYSALTSEQAILLPTLDDALNRYICHYQQGRKEAGRRRA